jgi:hypothetical protein
VIKIFSKLKRKEGLWEFVMTGKIMQWMSDIEEEGLGDEKCVPEDAVAKIMDMKVDSTQRTTQLSDIQGVRGCPGQNQLQKTTIHW